MTAIVAFSSPWWLEKYEQFMAWRLIQPVARRAFPKLSPFTAVSVFGRDAVVEFESQQYKLLSIEGIPTNRLMRLAEMVYEDRAEKRFREDLVEVLNAAGIKGKTEVDLKLENLQTGKVTNVANAKMTYENRQRVYGAVRSAYSVRLLKQSSDH